jgi:hypothetical protein
MAKRRADEKRRERKAEKQTKAEAARAKKRSAAREKSAPPVNETAPDVKGNRPRAKAASEASGPPSGSPGSPVATGDQKPRRRSPRFDLTPEERAAEHRARAAERSRQNYAASAELGEIPKCANPERRERCRLDACGFISEYFAGPHDKPLSPLHFLVIAFIARCLLHGGLFAQAIFRGFAKTTLGVRLMVWAIVYGHRRYIVLFGNKLKFSRSLLSAVKTTLESNERIAEDFPELVHAIRAFGGKHQRAKSQTYQGVSTGAEWSTDRIVIPNCPSGVKGAPDEHRTAGGWVIVDAVAKGSARGSNYLLPDGDTVRPDFFLGDDIETTKQAKSAAQVENHIDWIYQDWLLLGGHHHSMAGVINGTNAARGSLIDQITDPKNGRFAAWQKQRVPMVLQWADAHDTLWMDDYATIRRAFGADDADAQAKAHVRATEFYLAKRTAMDAGCKVAWEHCYKAEDGEVSAIQHAYNLLIDLGEEAFATECQNEPKQRESEIIIPSATAIANKQHGLGPGIIDPATTHLVAYIDQQDSCLYWGVGAFWDFLSGHLVDFGGWPNQQQRYWTLSNLRYSLQSYYAEARPEHNWPGMELDTDAAIAQGLTDLTRRLFAQRYPLPNGAGFRSIDLIAIDIANGNRSGAMKRWMLHSPDFARLVGFIGKGIGPGNKPIGEWGKEKGERKGLEWVHRRDKTGVPYALVNRNYHLKRLFDSLRLPVGALGSFAMPKVADVAALQMIGDHCQAVSADLQRSEMQDRSVWTFADKPGVDNHLLDVLYNLPVVAMIAGATTPGETPRGQVAAAPTARKPRKSRKLG